MGLASRWKSRAALRDEPPEPVTGRTSLRQTAAPRDPAATRRTRSMGDIVDWDRYGIFRVMPNGVLGWVVAVSTIEAATAKSKAFSASDPDIEYFLYDIVARRKMAPTG